MLNTKVPFFLDCGSLDFAKDHIGKFGDTDILPVHHLYEALFKYWDKPTKKTNFPPNSNCSTVREWLESTDLHQWITQERNYREFLVPKSRFGFRRAILMNPVDTLVFTALVHQMGKTIQEVRDDLHANVFSYHFEGKNGRMFSTSSTFRDFQTFTREVDSTAYPYVVCADIADFLNQISLHQLENSLVRIGFSTEAKILNSFFLSFSSGNSFGIPVGYSAAKLLSEVSLMGVDVFMASPHIIYTRYNSDFRIFSKSLDSAYNTLLILCKQVYTNTGCTLQQYKTSIQKTEHLKRSLFEDVNQSTHSSKLSAILKPILNFDEFDNNWSCVLTPVINEIKAIDLKKVLTEQLDASTIDETLVPFCLDWMSRTFDPTTPSTPPMFEEILTHSQSVKCFAVFKSFVKYFTAVYGKLESESKKKVLNNFINILETPVGSLDYHRVLVFNFIATKEQISDLDSSWTLKYIRFISKEQYSPELLCAVNKYSTDVLQYYKEEFRLSMKYWDRLGFIEAAKQIRGQQGVMFVNYFSKTGEEKLFKKYLRISQDISHNRRSAKFIGEMKH